MSRFQVTPRGSLIADPKTEQVIIEWPAGGHNGGCLRFGPDGYLYIATGDGSGIADGLETGQKIDDLLGAILRIDVDHSEAGRSYAIPKDNPFVGTVGARGEIWSFGHRQVWKFSFDDQKRLWAGEVGQDLWEMIYLIQRGGNYGWSVNEGRHPSRPKNCRDWLTTTTLRPNFTCGHDPTCTRTVLIVIADGAEATPNSTFKRQPLWQ